MAATDLSQVSVAVSPRWLPAGLPRAWLYAYIAIWLAMLTFAAIVALTGPGILVAAHDQGERLVLSAELTPPPQADRVLLDWVLNVQVAAWPLLLGILGAQRHALSRRLADMLVVGCFARNLLRVGGALGVYGVPLLPYVPQWPFEWAGLALGAGSWIVQRRRDLTSRERLLWLGLIVVVLLFAAVLESVAVPHQ
jgi:hypothetical protein